MGMDHPYAWRLTDPDSQLVAHIDSERDGRIAFDATLSLTRVSLSPATFARRLLRHPLLTMRIAGQIYLHGLVLKLKGARYFPNPSGAPLFGRFRRANADAARVAAARGTDEHGAAHSVAPTNDSLHEGFGGGIFGARR